MLHVGIKMRGGGKREIITRVQPVPPSQANRLSRSLLIRDTLISDTVINYVSTWKRVSPPQVPATLPYLTTTEQPFTSRRHENLPLRFGGCTREQAELYNHT